MPGTFGFLPFDTSGFIEQELFANPAVSTQFFTTIQANVCWLPYGVAFTLTCSAVVNVRRATVLWQPNVFGTNETIVQSQNTQAASQTFRYNVRPGIEPSVVATNNVLNLRLPLTYLWDGLFYVFIDGMRVGDQLSNITMLRRVWRTP